MTYKYALYYEDEVGPNYFTNLIYAHYETLKAAQEDEEMLKQQGYKTKIEELDEGDE